MAYQFIHCETYSRKKTEKKFSTKEILQEARRDDGSCPHVENPEPPNQVYGISLDELESLHDSMCDNAKMTNSKGQTRSIRKDQQTLGTVILSYPAKDENQDEKQYSKDYENWKKLSINWLKEKYGDELKTVIEHTDEKNPHLHAYLIPENLKADKYNIGRNAKSDYLKSDEAKKLEPKEANKIGDRKYKEEWRKWQDSYYEKVGVQAGLSRIGPGGRRLSRKEWQQEKQQSQSLKKAVSQKNSFVSKTKKEAYSERDRIIAEAKEQAQKILKELDSKKQELENIQNNIKQEEDKLSKIKDVWFVKRILNNVREEGVKEGIKKSTGQISKLRKSISKLKSEKKTLEEEKEFSEKIRREYLSESGMSDLENHKLKNEVKDLKKENNNLSKDRDNYKNKWAELDNKLSLQDKKSGYTK